MFNYIFFFLLESHRENINRPPKQQNQKKKRLKSSTLVASSSSVARNKLDKQRAGEQRDESRQERRGGIQMWRVDRKSVV